MVGVGAIIFNDLSNNRIKDEIFDWKQILNFAGETGPYMQYTVLRLKKSTLPSSLRVGLTLGSVLKKYSMDASVPCTGG